ncbi:MAG: NAD(P)H-hydrate dehydratase [Desulfovibrionaceae bacterium]|nr:NAD(P)H-hydrate dehydratase [Desulfovibrionaceae bacterium]
MWLICGTIPDADFPLTEGGWSYDADAAELVLTERVRPEEGPELRVPAWRGTPALLAAALQTARAMECRPCHALLAGDIGDGDGSAGLYAYLAARLAGTRAGNGAGLEEGREGEQEEGGSTFYGLTFHYLFPDLDGHNRVLAALESLEPRPLLCADAGFMYVAKMSGYASFYDLFTPDAGELAFLADEKAPHPLYTRGFLGEGEADVPALIERANAYGNAARTLLVKGKTDVLARDGRVLDTVSEPQVPALEAIGGTGDIVAGIATALLACRVPMVAACLAAARAGRRAGELARPTPATQVADILPHIPQAVLEAMEA